MRARPCGGGARRMMPAVEREGAVTTRDGRTLSYVERGRPDGVPLVVCHGTPGSRYTRHPDPEI